MSQFMIEDGGGSGVKATVETNKRRLRVDSRMADRLFYTSRDDAQSFSWASGTYNYDAADTILLIKNTSATKPLYITKIWLSGDTDTRVVIHRPTTVVTTPTGTAVTATNLNGQESGTTASATAIRDETTNAQGSIIWSGEIQAATDPYVVDLSGAVSLATNQSIGVDFVTDGGACDVTIFGYFEAITATS